MTPDVELDTTCTARTHGTASAWQSWRCTCPGAREEYNRQQMVARKERQLGNGRRLLPAAPFQRLIRDLMAAGWPGREIAQRIGWNCGEIHTLLSQRTHLRRDTAARIKTVYDELHAIAGPSDLTRRRAADADLWRPALPASGSARMPEPVDEVAVLRAVNGDPPASITRTERREAVRQMHSRGMSYEEMAQHLRTHQRMIHRDLSALGLILPTMPESTVAS